VDVGIVDARDKPATSCINHLSAGMLQLKNLGVGADRIDASILDRESGRFRLAAISREDNGIKHDQVSAGLRLR
jgi:hypothetical protein